MQEVSDKVADEFRSKEKKNITEYKRKSDGLGDSGRTMEAFYIESSQRSQEAADVWVGPHVLCFEERTRGEKPCELWVQAKGMRTLSFTFQNVKKTRSVSNPLQTLFTFTAKVNTLTIKR